MFYVCLHVPFFVFIFIFSTKGTIEKVLNLGWGWDQVLSSYHLICRQQSLRNEALCILTQQEAVDDLSCLHYYFCEDLFIYL